MICVMLMAISKLNIKGSKNIGMKTNAVCSSKKETQTSIDEFHQSVFFQFILISNQEQLTTDIVAQNARKHWQFAIHKLIAVSMARSKEGADCVKALRWQLELQSLSRWTICCQAECWRRRKRKALGERPSNIPLCLIFEITSDISLALCQWGLER